MEITFDLPALVITCKMVDGTLEEWPLMQKGCLRALEAVVTDVHEFVEVDKETESENERRRSESPAAPSGKVTRHKKQRSLLMSLVA